jgi:hypothetical protein
MSESRNSAPACVWDVYELMDPRSTVVVDSSVSMHRAWVAIDAALTPTVTTVALSLRGMVCMSVFVRAMRSPEARARIKGVANCAPVFQPACNHLGDYLDDERHPLHAEMKAWVDRLTASSHYGYALHAWHASAHMYTPDAPGGGAQQQKPCITLLLDYTPVPDSIDDDDADAIDVDAVDTTIA